MKNLLFTLAFVFVASLSFAQWQQSGSTLYYNGGSVGIGTSTPALQFEMTGNFQMGHNKFFVARRNDNSQHTVFGLDANNNFVFNFAGAAEGKSSGLALGFAGVGKNFDLIYNDGLTQNFYLRVQDDGKVGIGTVSPTERLTVNGGILCEEARVVQDVADYVFDDDYELMSLEKLEGFIKENHHLPNVVSQKEVEENGGTVPLGDFSVSLLEKLEELTLHVIDLNKRINQLEKENAQLKSIMGDR